MDCHEIRDLSCMCMRLEAVSLTAHLNLQPVWVRQHRLLLHLLRLRRLYNDRRRSLLHVVAAERALLPLMLPLVRRQSRRRQRRGAPSRRRGRGRRARLHRGLRQNNGPLTLSFAYLRDLQHFLRSCQTRWLN